jgi:[ribosomal protein S5]-alanine N-acetyltransferase
MRILENSVIRLEPQVVAHAEAMFEVLSDPAIYEYENAPPPSLAWLRTRFGRLESRLSPDGAEDWLNWVIRLPSSALIGYVQATVYPASRAAIAYELNSRYWGKGLATTAVALMIEELVANYDVKTLSAVLKATNSRSAKLLQRLGFSLAPEDLRVLYKVEPDELLMLNSAPAT